MGYTTPWYTQFRGYEMAEQMQRMREMGWKKSGERTVDGAGLGRVGEAVT